MVGNKPIAKQWWDNTKKEILINVAIAAACTFFFGLFLFIIPDYVVFVLITFWSVFGTIAVRKYVSYKRMLRVVEAQSDLGHKLQLAFNKEYEKESVELGAITEYGIITGHGFAPWDRITKITARGKETGLYFWSLLLTGEIFIYRNPAYLKIDVELEDKKRYSMKVFFVQKRDVSQIIDRYIERALSYNGRIEIDNTYTFVN